MRIAVEWKMVASSRQVPPYQPMADAVRYCLREKLGVLLALVCLNGHGFIRKPGSSRKRYLEGWALDKNGSGSGVLLVSRNQRDLELRGRPHGFGGI